MPWPICGQELTTLGSRSQLFVDCREHHRATTPPDQRREAYMRARLAEIETLSNPGAGTRRTRLGRDRTPPSMNLKVCSQCAAWIMAPPG